MQSSCCWGHGVWWLTPSFCLQAPLNQQLQRGLLTGADTLGDMSKLDQANKASQQQNIHHSHSQTAPRPQTPPVHLAALQQYASRLCSGKSSVAVHLQSTASGTLQSTASATVCHVLFSGHVCVQGMRSQPVQQQHTIPAAHTQQQVDTSNTAPPTVRPDSSGPTTHIAAERTVGPLLAISVMAMSCFGHHQTLCRRLQHDVTSAWACRGMQPAVFANLYMRPGCYLTMHSKQQHTLSSQLNPYLAHRMCR